MYDVLNLYVFGCFVGPLNCSLRRIDVASLPTAYQSAWKERYPTIPQRFTQLLMPLLPSSACWRVGREGLLLAALRPL